MSREVNQELLDTIVKLADEAGDILLEFYGRSDLKQETKDNDTPVTEADIAASHYLIEALEKLTPEWPVLSEEAADIDWAIRKAWQSYWLIDPLDGTKEFISKTDEFTVNIALIIDHHPVLGVVGVPAKSLMYSALNGGQAMKRDGEAWTRIHCMPARKPFDVLTSRRAHSRRLLGYLDRLEDIHRHYAGSALKMCYIAEGKGDLYPKFGPTSEWDTAAAQCILEAAGGRITDLAGEPLAYNTKDGLLNPRFLAWGDPNFDPLSYLPEDQQA